jgi:hypothetical protein
MEAPQYVEIGAAPQVREAPIVHAHPGGRGAERVRAQNAAPMLPRVKRIMLLFEIVESNPLRWLGHV